MPNPFSSNLALVKEYQAAMKQFGGNPLSYGSIEGYVAAQTMIEGIKRCGKSVTRANLRDAMEKLEIDLGGFKLAFSPSSHQASNFVQITTIGQDGKLI